MVTATKTSVVSRRQPAAKDTSQRWVYRFEEVDEAQELVGGSWDKVRALLGGKGSGLGDMTRAGVPVPPGFTITTEACNAYLAEGNQFPATMWDQVMVALKSVEKKTDKILGDPKKPLLVSVRSGAKFSMPGMMDTVLNLGMNDEVAEGMVALTKDPRFVYDSYRRLVQMFGSVVMGIADEPFEDYLTETKKQRNVKLDVELTADDWKQVTAEFKKIYRTSVEEDFPQDPYKQLAYAIEAVFKSWNGKRAIDYRNAARIPHNLWDPLESTCRHASLSIL